MAFELEILVVNQNKPITIPFLSQIEVINEVEDDMILRLNNTWKLMSQTKGIWYSLVKEDDGIKNAFLLCTSDFEIESEKMPIPFWIEDEDIIYHLTPLIIHQEFISEFRAILEFLIKHSPTNTLMFLARYQGSNYEIVQGNIPLNQFFHHLKNNKISLNICYIITNA